MSKTRLQYGLALAALIIAALVITSGMLYFRKRNQQVKSREKLAEVSLQNSILQEEKLKLQVRKQSRDLNDLSGQMMFIHELNKQINEKLRGLDQLKVDEQKEVLSELSRLTRRNMQEIDIKGALQKNLEKVNNSFYDRLDELTNSKISKGEKEIAALLRLGISDNQISELRGTSISAVRVSRFRIRQELPINKEQDLINYLVNI